MKQELVLLATTNNPDNASIIDKRLQGYATIQFVQNIRGGLHLSYDEEEYDLQSGSWFFPAHPWPAPAFPLPKTGWLLASQAHSVFLGHWLKSGAEQEFGPKSHNKSMKRKSMQHEWMNSSN
jgi:hypothetical protein